MGGKWGVDMEVEAEIEGGTDGMIRTDRIDGTNEDGKAEGD